MILVAGWEAYLLGGHSALWPSLVSALMLMPTMAFGLVAGTYADRMNRAKLATLGQSVNATCCAAAGACVLAHVMTLDGVLVAAAVVGVGNAIQGPAWQALIPDLVGTQRMVNAAFATRIAQQGSEFFGPGIGTAVLTTSGPGWTFLLCAGFYVCGAAMLFHLRGYGRAARQSGLAPVLSVRRQVVQGVSYTRRTSPLGLLFGWVTCHCSLTMATFGILPTIASVNFHGAAGAYGLLLTTFGAGSILGPLILMSLRHQPQAGWVLWIAGILSGAPLVVLGFAHVELLGMAMSMVAGMAQAVFMAMIYASVMTCSDSWMRGRVASIQLSATTGAMGLASLGWGALVSLLPAGLVLALPGTAFVVVCIGVAPRVRRLNGLVAAQGASVRVSEQVRTPPLAAKL